MKIVKRVIIYAFSAIAALFVMPVAISVLLGVICGISETVQEQNEQERRRKRSCWQL